MSAIEKLKIQLKIRSYQHKRIKINSKKNNAKKSKPFFSNIDIELENGRILCLLGLSGIGKTTLLRIILSDSAGVFDGVLKYYINDQEIDINALRKNGYLGYLSQETTLIPWKKVIHNIYLPSNLNNKLDRPNDGKINHIFKSLNLDSNIKESYPFKLSFGTRQRVALARLLLYQPKFLMIDELFTGLDTATSDLIEDFLKQYVLDKNALCFFVTHDCERAVNMEAMIQILRHDRTLSSLKENDSNLVFIKSILLEDIAKTQ